MINHSAISLVYHGVIYSKKNSKQIRRRRNSWTPFIASSDRAKAMEEDMTQQFMYGNTAGAFPFEVDGKDKPVEVIIKIWEKDHTRRDLDNQASSIMDALVLAGIIADDSIKIVKKMTVELAGFDKEDPRAEVEIRECTC